MKNTAMTTESTVNTTKGETANSETHVDTTTKNQQQQKKEPSA